MARDENRSGDLRRDCAQALGQLGEKEKAARILIDLYLKQKDKYSYEARRIYGDLWDVTKV
jgi:hypothetical protein